MNPMAIRNASQLQMEMMIKKLSEEHKLLKQPGNIDNDRRFVHRRVGTQASAYVQVIG